MMMTDKNILDDHAAELLQKLFDRMINDAEAEELLGMMDASAELREKLGRNFSTEYELRFLGEQVDRFKACSKRGFGANLRKRFHSRRMWLSVFAANLSVVALIFLFFLPEWNTLPTKNNGFETDSPTINYSTTDPSWSDEQEQEQVVAAFKNDRNYIASPADEWTELLNRSEGWSGADGIFTANLDGTIDNGIERRPEQRTLFVFSDTILSKVDPVARKRSDSKMVNHSFALLQGNQPLADKIEFFYPQDGKTPSLPLKPAVEGQWYWLSECFVLGNDRSQKLYSFLLRMEKTEGTHGFGFRHVGVDLLRIDIKEGRPDFSTAKILADNPAEPRIAFFRDSNKEGATVALGIGVLENIKESGVSMPDGYVYIYGYRDEKGKRSLVAARFRPDDVESFKKWEYYVGKREWSTQLVDAIGLVEQVSTELSVTPIPNGPQKGKYALIYTPGTMGSKIAMRLGLSPVGPFGEERILYEETESRRFGKGIYAYNAKAHPVLSKSGEMLITYNINSMDNTLRIFREADIYRPRFIRVWLDEL